MSLIARVRHHLHPAANHLRLAIGSVTKRRHFTQPAITDAIEIDGKHELKKEAFDLRVESFEARSKLEVIKAIRELWGLGLKEAKELLEEAPSGLIKKGVEKEEAEQIIEKMKAVGAKVVMV